MKFNSNNIFAEILKKYNESHRYYHNFNHIKYCLTQFDCVRDIIRDTAEVELALWFHDIIYNTQFTKNESDSADFAKHILSKIFIPQNTINKIRKLILATQHTEVQKNNDEKLMVDIDLSILGADERIFNQYETNIKKEYHWVPTQEYCVKRIQILEKFTNKKQIFQSSYFNDKLERQARKNIANLIQNLRQSLD